MSPARDRVALALGTMAMTLAVLALVPPPVVPGWGSRGGPGGEAAGSRGGGWVVGPGVVGVTELAEELASGAAVVEPLELARWIRDRRPARVLDVRDSSAFFRFSVPTAQHARLSELPAVPLNTPGPVVLYDDGSGEAARAWLLLRRLGHPEVRVLAGGVAGWIHEVIQPVLPAGTPEERVRFERVAELSRYFGGVPRVGSRQPPPAGGPDRADAAVRLLSRRGCY